MTESTSGDTDVHDLSHGVIHALATLDVSALSSEQLRRLNAALLHAGEDVAREIRNRADDDPAGDTVRVPSPRLDHPR